MELKGNPVEYGKTKNALNVLEFKQYIQILSRFGLYWSKVTKGTSIQFTTSEKCPCPIGNFDLRVQIYCNSA